MHQQKYIHTIREHGNLASKQASRRKHTADLEPHREGLGLVQKEVAFRIRLPVLVWHRDGYSAQFWHLEDIGEYGHRGVDGVRDDEVASFGTALGALLRDALDDGGVRVKQIVPEQSRWCGFVIMYRAYDRAANMEILVVGTQDARPDWGGID